MCYGKTFVFTSVVHRVSLVDVGSVALSGFRIKVLIDKLWISPTNTLVGNNASGPRSGVRLDTEPTDTKAH